MSAGWQAVVYGVALVLFSVAAAAAHARHAAWPVFVSAGLALFTIVPLWSAVSAIE